MSTQPAAATQTGLQFRAMTTEDLGVVLRNETRSYAFPWTAGIFADCLTADHECRVVLLRRGVVGHGILMVAAGEGHLLNVCIARDQQDNGLGRQLVEHMLERAQQRRASVVFLEVRPSNLKACGLYESIGFNEIGLRPNYYPAAAGHEDAIVMAMQL